MRKTSKKTLIGGLLALSLILTGTGYAYWTDTLNITTKATTGDLDVTFADLALHAQYGDETIGGWSIVDGIGDTAMVADNFFGRGTSYNKIAKDGSIDAYKERAKGYNNVEFDAELEKAAPIPKTVGPYTSANTNGSDQINLVINQMYPGYAQAFRTDILNVGSIAAKLSNIKFDYKNLDKSSELDNMLGIALYIHQEQYNPANSAINDAPVFTLVKSLVTDESQYFTVGKVDFIRLSALRNMKPETIKAVIQNATILTSPATDNRMDLFIGIAMDPDKEGVYTTGSTDNLKDKDDTLSQNKAVEVSIDFLWDQFNVDKDAATPNILQQQNRK